jgi:2-iminobutanoate/2-iminopropanoate deaminase
MSVEIVSAGPPPRGPYAGATLATGTRVLEISGALPEGPDNEIVSDDAEEQARQCLKNIDAVLTAAGATRQDVTRIGVFLTDMADRPAVARARIEFFGDHHPSATLVEISRLVPPDARVEIDATAIF